MSNSPMKNVRMKFPNACCTWHKERGYQIHQRRGSPVVLGRAEKTLWAWQDAERKTARKPNAN